MGASLDVGAKKRIRHLSALSEENNRAKSQSRRERKIPGHDRQRRVKFPIGDLPICDME